MNIDGYLVEVWYDDDADWNCTVFWPAENPKYNASLEELEERLTLENTYGESHRVPKMTIDRIMEYVYDDGFSY